MGLVALAEECLKDGGKMIINGDNKIGIKSFLQNISYQWPPEITMIKKKGRIAIYKKKNQLFDKKNAIESPNKIKILKIHKY